MIRGVASSRHDAAELLLIDREFAAAHTGCGYRGPAANAYPGRFCSGGFRPPEQSDFFALADARARVARKGDNWPGGPVGGDNARMPRSEHRGVRPDSAQAFYCGTCWRYVGPTGKRVGYESEEIIVWVECPWCLGRRLEREAAEEERRRREEERTRPRQCALDGCAVMFVPATVWQRHCCDEHRWKAHRLKKAAARNGGVAG
jgi:hypothetical protein